MSYKGRMKRLFQLMTIFLLSGFPMAADLSVGNPDQTVESYSPGHALPQVRVGQKSLELVVPGVRPVRFEIFSITGQSVKSIRVNAGSSVRIELPEGFYIVKCDSWTKRVMIK